MKLVIDHGADLAGGGCRGSGSRPALRVIQGGRTTPRRLVAPPSEDRVPRVAAPAESTVPVIDLDEVPILLRPIPAWVPRLW